jgi:hypothetical protein
MDHDMNMFEAGGKAVRRTYEALEDTGAALLSCTFDHYSFDLVAKGHVGDIERQAKRALNHDDSGEATHQLERELYFSSVFGKDCRGFDESARAGLKGLTKSENCLQVQNEMNGAFKAAQADNTVSGAYRGLSRFYE